MLKHVEAFFIREDAVQREKETKSKDESVYSILYRKGLDNEMFGDF